MNTHTPEDGKQSLPEEAGQLSRGEVTQLLLDWNGGDPAARDRLIEYIYADLLRMAHRRLQRERAGPMMQTGTLAHEVCLRLVNAAGVPCRNHKEFFGIAAHLMREVLVDAARKRDVKRRGGNQRPVPLEDVILAVPARNPDLVALDEALERLAEFNDELSQVVDLRFFAGCTIEETAEILDVAPDTVKRRWRKAKLYLYDQLKEADGAGDGSTEMERD